MPGPLPGPKLKSHILIPGLRGLTSLKARSFNGQEVLGGILQDSKSESMFYSDLKSGIVDESKETKSKQNEPSKTYKKCRPKSSSPIY